MSAPSSARDPRSIVTPDAFELSKELLGLKLAPPGKRLAAILIDLMVIGAITALTQSFALVLGVVAAVLFIRAGFKRTPVPGSVFGRAMRGSVGCLGVLIAILTATLWASFGPGGRGEGVTISVDGRDMGSALLGALGERTIAAGLGEAETLAEAEEVTRDVMEAARELGVSNARLRTMLLDGVPEDAAWADRAPELFDRLLPPDAVERPEPEVVAETVEPRDVVAVADEVSLYATEEAVEAYADLLRSGRQSDMDQVRREALQARIVTDLAADTLRSLQSRVAALQDDVAELEEDLEETEAEVDELEDGGGLFGWFRNALDELGFGFGWASLYLTVMLSWWNGQTIGKRLMKIRVLRLDGEPITWWIAFERAGGYAAGFATGLLGFLQIYWDANRQAIHDRIAGTVVVLDGTPKVLDWESAL
jgi:uncharacterized RDD family membrane protein YckC